MECESDTEETGGSTMTDYTEITENYKALLNMCDTNTAADVIMFRSDELTEQMLVDIMYSMKGEIMLRQMEEEG